MCKDMEEKEKVSMVSLAEQGCARGHKRSAGEMGTPHPQSRRDLGSKVLGFLWTVMMRHLKCIT